MTWTTRNWILGLALVTSLGGCASEVAEPETTDTITSGGKADGVEAVVITDDDAGRVVDLPIGAPLDVRLRAAATAGYDWRLVTADRTFGRPETDRYEVDSEAFGSGGSRVFSWSGGNPVVQVGETYTMVFGYGRPWQTRVERTIEISVHIVDAAPAFDGLVITGDDPEGEYELEVGKGVQVRLPAATSAGYDWRITIVDQTLGQPDSTTFEADPSGALGSSGTRVFTWNGNNPLIREGELYTLWFGYGRPWQEEVEQTRAYSIRMVRAGGGFDGLVLGRDDAEGTFELSREKGLQVRLSAAATAGYDWRVLPGDREFGAPTETYEVDSDAVGSGGTRVFTWPTNPLLETGKEYTVSFGYGRPWSDQVEETVRFTVRIVD